MKSSIKSEFRRAFVKIILMSILLSLLTLFIWIKNFNDLVYPANYFEKMIPGIMERIEEKGDPLDPDFQEKMEEIIPKEHMKYDILDGEGRRIYSNMDRELIQGRDQLLESINSTKSLYFNSFYKTYPIIREGMVEGAIILSYSLTPQYRNKGSFSNFLFKYAPFLPIFYVIVFTLILSRSLSKKINEPIGILLQATEKIANQELDFHIDYREDNELGQLSRAFEDMRWNLKNSLEKQWELEEARRENISAIGHDLRTPLSIVKISSESLMERDLEEDDLAYVSIINRNNERALKLLENMKELSRLEDPSFSLQLADLDLGGLLDRKAAEYKILTGEAGIGLVYRLEDGRRSKLGLYDRASLEQVLDNILSNAYRYSDPGDRIYFRAWLEDEGCQIEIENTGSSFSKSDLKKIFDKFYKGDSSRSFRSGESGLGLYISKTIVELHGGSIRAFNREGRACISLSIKNMGDLF